MYFSNDKPTELYYQRLARSLRAARRKVAPETASGLLRTAESLRRVIATGEPAIPFFRA